MPTIDDIRADLERRRVAWEASAPSRDADEAQWAAWRQSAPRIMSLPDRDYEDAPRWAGHQPEPIPASENIENAEYGWRQILPAEVQQLDLRIGERVRVHFNGHSAARNPNGHLDGQWLGESYSTSEPQDYLPWQYQSVTVLADLTDTDRENMQLDPEWQPELRTDCPVWIISRIERLNDQV